MSGPYEGLGGSIHKVFSTNNNNIIPCKFLIRRCMYCIQCINVFTIDLVTNSYLE